MRPIDDCSRESPRPRAILTSPVTSVTSSRVNIAIQYLQNSSVPFLNPHSPDWALDTTAFNLRVAARPALLVYAQTAQQVQDVVACGVAAGLKVSARCGGHSYASLGLGGEDDHLVVDLTSMASITVDPNTHIATVGAGARLGDMASGLYNQGKRAISHGSCPAVGISGHILHGGYGWISHNKGLTLDCMVGADVVLANATHVHCSAIENPDLFWAIRGAGSSFGIVTSYELQTFAAPALSIPYNVTLNWQTEAQKANGVKALVEFAQDMPADLNMRLSVHGSGGHTFEGVHHGDVNDLRSILAPLLKKTGGTLNSQPGTWLQGLQYYAEHNSLVVPQPYDEHGNFYATSLTLKNLSGDSLTNFVHYWQTTALNFNQGGWFIQLDLHGGAHSAVSAVPNSATAYAHRDKAFLIQLYHYMDNGQPYPSGGIALLKGWINATTEPLKEGDWGMYINYVDSQLDRGTAERLYWADNLDRLKLLKKKFDPTEVFYYPQSISPAA